MCGMIAVQVQIIWGANLIPLGAACGGDDPRRRPACSRMPDRMAGRPRLAKTLTEIRADLQHLRRWRRSVEQAQSYTFKAVITVIVTGFVGAVWLGVKATLGK